MMLLKSKYKQMLLDIFLKLPVQVEVWAHGSRVKGTAHDGSDLDLVIRTPNNEKISFEVMMDLKDNIMESNIPILIDLFEWTRLPESFHRNIIDCHEVIFSNITNMVNEPQAEYKKTNNT